MFTVAAFLPFLPLIADAMIRQMGDDDFAKREAATRFLENTLWDREHDQHVVASLMKRVQHDFEPETWQAYQRYALGGESARQVAEALGMSLNSVLLAKSRVLKRLRQEVAGLVD
jgi:RNA polymerase sigma-70 factor (ECF subfamily)